MAPLVAVVDDDVSVRKSLARLIRSVRLDVRAFASAEEFLNSAPHLQPDCLILDSGDELLDAVNVALKWTSGGQNKATDHRRSHE
jgi:FixJ family two-component response regulator